MSLAKAVFSGTVYREPQKRFTANNVPITDFTFDIGTKEESNIIRVCTVGNYMSDLIEKNVRKGDRLVVEGNMKVITAKTETGTEKRVLELDLSSFEKLSGGSVQQTSTSEARPEEEEIVKFTSPQTEELIGEDEIPF